MASYQDDHAPTLDLLSVLGMIFARVALVRLIEADLEAAHAALTERERRDEDTYYEIVHAEDVTPEMRTLGEDGFFAYELARVAGRTLRPPSDQLSLDDLAEKLTREAEGVEVRIEEVR